MEVGMLVLTIDSLHAAGFLQPSPLIGISLPPLRPADGMRQGAQEVIPAGKKREARPGEQRGDTSVMVAGWGCKGRGRGQDEGRQGGGSGRGGRGGGRGRGGMQHAKGEEEEVREEEEVAGRAAVRDWWMGL